MSGAGTVEIPTSLVKKQERNQKLIAEKNRIYQKKTKLRKVRRKEITKRAEKYEKEYETRERTLIRQRRTAKNAGYFFREPEAKVALVIRLRGINGVHPKPRKILQLFRLLQINNACFVRLNKATINMLKRIEPYVAYGYPNLKTIRELVYKRGYGKVHGQRIPLTSNDIIRKSLGKRGIICTEDLIHELYTAGPNFKYANKFLWPFKLSNPRGGFTRKLVHFAEGGDAGNREEYINELARRMN
eukprot:TRINITY_DN669_c0_g1_i2.p1 TRINITY_DN669_c0_g1~~TRINITY_DN669_c0_g1_i2.p1  ORF type:complete len:244 (-),score=44.74 TRINITY_DN669_c0_g1_i2:66-797(-)